MAKGKKTGGRIKGKPNKATADARAAIGRFVDGNAHRLQEWLDDIAEGMPELDETGEPVPGKFLKEPNPRMAFDMFQSVVEYHVPKLQRTELTGKDGKDLTLVQAAKDDEAL